MEGIIEWIGETQFVTNKFCKREFVVRSDGKYPQPILFQMSQDNCDHLNNYKPGDRVKVDYNLRGREWKSPLGESKYFNTLEAWKITGVSNN